MGEITAEHFTARVGYPPEKDDLERCNCPKAGQIGHLACGWNEFYDMPVFCVGPFLPLPAAGESEEKP